MFSAVAIIIAMFIIVQCSCLGFKEALTPNNSAYNFSPNNSGRLIILRGTSYLLGVHHTIILASS